MACIITINNVAGAGNDGEAAISITISGRAEDCDSRKVIVKLFCAGVPSGFQEADVDANGNWSAEFGAPARECECGEAVRVEVECEGNPGCRAIFEGDLSCLPPEEECPNIGEITVDISEDCDAEGHRAVTLIVHIANVAADDMVAQWDFGDGDFSDAFVVDAGAAEDVERSHDYAPGSYTATLQTVLPEECPSVQVDIEIQECPPACLEANQVAVEISDCNDDGTRDVTFTFPGEISARLDFGDGEDAEFVGRSQTHSYRPRGEPYTAELTIQGCDPIEIPVQIESCPPWCPEVDDVAVVVGEACSPDGARSVTFIFPREITAELDFGDGSAPASFTDSSWTHAYHTPIDADYTAVLTAEGCDPIEILLEVPGCPVCLSSDQIDVEPAEDCNDDGTRNVTFTFPSEITGQMDFRDGETGEFVARSVPHAYVPRAEPYTAVLTAEGCDPVEVTVTVESCPENGGGGGDVPWLCGAMFTIVAILTVIAVAVTLAITTWQVCIPVPPMPPALWWVVVGAWAVVALAIAAWYVQCAFDEDCPCPGRCDWMALAWIAALAGAITALYLSGCCPLWMALLSAGLFAAAAALFAAWVAECNPSLCLIWHYLALAVGTIAVTIISWIVLLPVIWACGLVWVEIAAGALGLIFSGLAVQCYAAQED